MGFSQQNVTGLLSEKDKSGHSWTEYKKKKGLSHALNYS